MAALRNGQPGRDKTLLLPELCGLSDSRSGRFIFLESFLKAEYALTGKAIKGQSVRYRTGFQVRPEKKATSVLFQACIFKCLLEKYM